MYLLKSLFLLVLFQLLGSVVSVSAQVVTTTTTPVGVCPVIDLSNFAPLGCVLSFSEASTRRISMNAETPSNTSLLSVGNAVSNHDGTWNAKTSIRYQLMGADRSVNSADWANAYNQCKEYSGEGGASGQWRLPTQRELQMIAVLHPQLRGISGFTSFNANGYWSSTEYNATTAWYVSFTNGNMGSDSKANASRVRCVRDL